MVNSRVYRGIHIGESFTTARLTRRGLDASSLDEEAISRRGYSVRTILSRGTAYRYTRERMRDTAVIVYPLADYSISRLEAGRGYRAWNTLSGTGSPCIRPGHPSQFSSICATAILTKYLLCWILEDKCEPSRPSPRTAPSDRGDRWDCPSPQVPCLLSSFRLRWDWNTSAIWKENL